LALFILDFCTFENLPLPAVYKQAITQPLEAFVQRLIFLSFCLCGARYKMKVLISFFAVLVLVAPLLNKFLGIV
jgi:hypothetical protein